MPLLLPKPNPERITLLVDPRHSRRAYLARRNTVRTGSAGANVTICSRVASTSMRCRTRRLWLLLAFAQSRNGTRTPTRQRLVGWSDLRRPREFGKNQLPEVSSRYLPIGSHIFPALNYFERRTFHLVNYSGRLFNHLPNDFTTPDNRSDQCLAHVRPFQTASPRFRDHLLPARMFKCVPFSTTNTCLLRPNSSVPSSRSGVPARVSLSRARLSIVINQRASKGWCPAQSPQRPPPQQRPLQRPLPQQHLRLQLPLNQASRPHLSPHHYLPSHYLQQLCFRRASPQHPALCFHSFHLRNPLSSNQHQCRRSRRPRHATAASSPQQESRPTWKTAPQRTKTRAKWETAGNGKS